MPTWRAICSKRCGWGKSGFETRLAVASAIVKHNQECRLRKKPKVRQRAVPK